MQAECPTECVRACPRHDAREDNNWALREAVEHSNLDVLKYLVEHFLLSADDAHATSVGPSCTPATPHVFKV
jgi:hypothetical protein